MVRSLGVVVSVCIMAITGCASESVGDSEARDEAASDLSAANATETTNVAANAIIQCGSGTGQVAILYRANGLGDCEAQIYNDYPTCHTVGSSDPGYIDVDNMSVYRFYVFEARNCTGKSHLIDPYNTGTSSFAGPVYSYRKS